MRKLIIVGVAVAALYVTTIGTANADNRYGIDDCYSSGRGTGDLVFITDEGKAEGLYVQIVGLDRDPTTFILVLPGETWQVTDGTNVIASGTVDTSDCGSGTTVPEEPTTTTLPNQACDDVECNPDGPPTTTPPVEPPPTTTTPPGRPVPPADDGGCPEGYFLDAVVGCVVIAEGG